MGLDRFIHAVRALRDDTEDVVARLELPAGQYALNVHQYALGVYEAFLRRFYRPMDGRIGAVAMNPGRNGAVQTGIPFTDEPWARQLGLDVPGLRGTPSRPLPAGTQEMSGRRLLAWAEHRFGEPRRMYDRIVFYITCPIAVLTRDPVRNVPLPDLKGANARRVFGLIQRHARRLVEASGVDGVLLLGRYAEKVWDALEDAPELPVARTFHPAAHVSRQRLHGAWDEAYSSLRPPKRSRETPT